MLPFRFLKAKGVGGKEVAEEQQKEWEQKDNSTEEERIINMNKKIKNKK